MADIDYYEDDSLWGGYQYITLEEVINNYIMSRVTGDHTIGVPRYQILYQAMRGLRELYFDVLKEIKAIELDLSPSLTVTLPPDYINYIRISWVDEYGKLHPMSIDTRQSIAKEYLQDSDYELLFDSEGCVLIGESETTPSNEEVSSGADADSYYNYRFCDNSFSPNLDSSRVFENGSYIINKSSGVINFSSSVEGKSVVIEYISDGLYTGCEGRPENEIRVHKFAESALLNFIYYELIKNSQAPLYEKQRARKEYYNSRRITKLRTGTLRVKELLQAFRKSTKWIK